MDVDKDIERLKEIRSELFDMANNASKNHCPTVAVMLHMVCNILITLINAGTNNT